MLKQEIYQGKAKILYKSDKEEEIYQYFKDDATAFNNLKKDIIQSKGILNNYISAHIMKLLSKNNVENHFIKRIDDRVQLVKKLEILPLEIIVRNVAAGSICKILTIKEGQKFSKPIIEFCYKEDKLGDPLINEDHIEKVLTIANKAEISKIKKTVLVINNILQKMFDEADIMLVDFKVEFGKDKAGNIILADEISPDSCRLWDKYTNQKMDKDRFRLDLGDFIRNYNEIAKRLGVEIN